MKVCLTFIKPDATEEALVFDTATEITLGRSPNCTYCLDFDPMVSRMHAVLLIDPPTVRIKDLNSTNGMIINGQPFGGVGGENSAQPVELVAGDEVIVGTTRLRMDLVTDNALDKISERTLRRSSAAESTVVKIGKLKHWKLSDFLSQEERMTALATNFPEIPGYRIKKYLGSSRRAAVYQALNRFGDKVAVKILEPGEPFTRKMFDDFSKSMEKSKGFHNRQLNALLDLGALGDENIYLVSEYVNGEDLASYLLRCTNHRIPLHAAYGLMLQICLGMGVGHQKGLVHRNLKPQNIILYDDSGKLSSQVTGIGVAKDLDHAGILAAGAVLESGDNHGYMPPELLVDARDFRPTTDVFSLAAVFYEMLTGSVPYDFSDIDEDPLKVVAEGRVIPLEDRMAGLPEPLVVAIDRCLSTDPDDRYASCVDMLEALELVRI